ncbi:hypothetical protein BD560DRAFT_442093 [Blakeslea trispora]|nr:hypothetical protein BD560DRAFT_442093 [Blakeslea trispora]
MKKMRTHGYWQAWSSLPERLQDKFARIPVARKRSVWQAALEQHVGGKRLVLQKEGGLACHFVKLSRDNKWPTFLLASACRSDKRLQCKDKQTLPVSEAILTKALANLRSYSNWLLAEFDVHMMHVYAIDDPKPMTDFYATRTQAKCSRAASVRSWVFRLGSMSTSWSWLLEPKQELTCLGCHLPHPVSSAPVSKVMSRRQGLIAFRT